MNQKFGVMLRNDPDDRVTELRSPDRAAALSASWSGKYLILERFGDLWMPLDSVQRGTADPWLPPEEPDRIVLPSQPGTVIAIGDWWFVRLRPYETSRQSAWEMLPLPTKGLSNQATRNGFHQQCVYADDIVLAEAEQEGGYEVVSAPGEKPEA